MVESTSVLPNSSLIFLRKFLIIPLEGKEKSKYFSISSSVKFLSFKIWSLWLSLILQQEIKNKLNPTKGRWIGKTIATTRPICRHLTKQQERLGFVSVDYLKATLKVYVPNGVPDADLGKGIIEGTTMDNFEKNRGGYNCRHKWIWIL